MIKTLIICQFNYLGAQGTSAWILQSKLIKEELEIRIAIMDELFEQITLKWLSKLQFRKNNTPQIMTTTKQG